MARIPDINPSGPASQEAPGSPRLGPAEFGASKGEAFEQLGAQVENTVDRLDNIYQETKANTAITQAQKRLQDYSFQLKNGPTSPDGSPVINPDTGLPQAPPDPDKHAELMQQKIDEVRQQTESDLAGNGIAIRKFHDDYNAFSDRQLMDTKVHAVDLMHQTIRADSQQTWQDRASNSINASDIERPQIEQQTAEEIDRMVAAKILTPEQGFAEKERFFTEVEVGHIRKILVSGPNGPRDVMTAIQNGEFSKLRNDVQERWMDIATRMQWSNDQKEIAAMAKDDRDSDRRDKKISDQAYEEAIDLDRRGALSNAWFNQNKDRLAPNVGHYKAVSDMLSGRTKPSNPHVLNELTQRLSTGQDIDAIQEDLQHWSDTGQINTKDYQKFWGMIRQNDDFKNSNWEVAGRKEIAKVVGGLQIKGVPMMGRQSATVDALSSWAQWRKDHGNDHNGAGPTPAEVRDGIDGIVKGASRQAMLDIPGINMPVPRFVVGGRNALYNQETGPTTLQNAITLTRQKRDKGEITEEEFKKEASKLRLWQTFMTPAPKPAAETK